MTRYMYKLAFYLICVISVLNDSFSQTEETHTFNWATHAGSDLIEYTIGYSNPASPQTLHGLNPDGTRNGTALLADTNTGTDSQTGALIELGFFNTDNSGTASNASPNTSSDLFHGIWTPITSKTTIGQDYSSSKSVGAGLFSFQSTFKVQQSGEAEAEGLSRLNPLSSD